MSVTTVQMSQPRSGVGVDASSDLSSAAASTSYSVDPDPLYERLRCEALAASSSEPALSCLLSRTVLHPSVATFEGAVAAAITHRLSLSCGSDPDVCPDMLRNIFERDLKSTDHLELGHTAAEAIREDALAHVNRDPACETLLEAMLFFKGYAAMVTHRIARRRWYGSGPGGGSGVGGRFVALWLQSQASAAFGVDVHPAATVGCGVMIDHATGVVVGETARIGDGCTLLHGVTLGGTGKDSGDRHPKVGKDVLIGANASVLGNISIGDGAKIGAGSVVLRPVPHGATAVGSPAKIIGWAKEREPGSVVDQLLVDVVRAGGGSGTGNGKATVSTESTTSLTSMVSAESSAEDDDDDDEEEGSGEIEVKEREEDDEAEEEQEEEQDQQKKKEAPDVDKHAIFAEPDHGALAGGDLNQAEDLTDLDPPRRHRSASYPLDASESRDSEDAPQQPGDAAGVHPPPRRPHSFLIEDLPNNDPCSPFRDFLLRRAPPGCVTYCALRALLHSEGCTDAEIGEVFLELLRRTGRPERRYVTRRFFLEAFPEVASSFAGLDAESRRRVVERATRTVSVGVGGEGTCIFANGGGKGRAEQ